MAVTCLQKRGNVRELAKSWGIIGGKSYEEKRLLLILILGKHQFLLA